MEDHVGVTPEKAATYTYVRLLHHAPDETTPTQRKEVRVASEHGLAKPSASPELVQTLRPLFGGPSRKACAGEVAREIAVDARMPFSASVHGPAVLELAAVGGRRGGGA